MQTVHLHCKVDLVNLDHLINFGDIHCHMISYTALVSGMDTCEKPLAVKRIAGKTPEEIRKTFNIKNDFTPEEEEQVRGFEGM